MKNLWKILCLLFVTLVLNSSLLVIGLSGQQTKSGGNAPARSSKSDISNQVEIIRTEHGVPHIRAANVRAAGYAFA